MKYPNLFRCGMHEWGGCDCDKICKQSIPQNAFRIIVAGSRGFTNYELLEKKLDHLLKNRPEVEIVSGGANGADKFGEIYAKKRNLALRVFPADWDKHGKSAGYKRNVEMAEYADAAVVFWDGQSKGSKHMIDIAESKELPTRVIKV